MRTKCACSGKDGVSSRWSWHPFVLFWLAVFVVVPCVKYDVMLGKVWDLFYSRMIADPVFRHLLLLLSVSLRPARPLKQAIKIDSLYSCRACLQRSGEGSLQDWIFSLWWNVIILFIMVKCYHFITDTILFQINKKLFPVFNSQKHCYTKNNDSTIEQWWYQMKWSNTMVLNDYCIHILWYLQYSMMF